MPPVCVSAAQDDLDEIVVTASLAGSPLERLPASVTVLGQDDLQIAGVEHFGDVMGLVPNLSSAGGTSRPRYFQIRGIGETEQYEGAPNPSVGFLIDDIDFSGIGMPAALFDISRSRCFAVRRAPPMAPMRLPDSSACDRRRRVRISACAGNSNWPTTTPGPQDWCSTTPSATATPPGDWRAHRYTSDGFRHNAYLDRTDTNGFDENLLRLRVQQHPERGRSR